MIASQYSKRFGLIVTAAGAGRRFGGPGPKQWSTLNGQPVVSLACQHFFPFSSLITLCVITAPRSDFATVEKQLNRLSWPFPYRVVEGGDTRASSVRQGFMVLDRVDAVLVHDGVRPNVSTAVIERVINGLNSGDCVIPAIALTDTVKRVQSGIVTATVPRSDLVKVQTPQGFRYSLLEQIYQSSWDPLVTDEASLVERSGQSVHVVNGCPSNIKITYPHDAAYLRFLMDERHQ